MSNVPIADLIVRVRLAQSLLANSGYEIAADSLHAVAKALGSVTAPTKGERDALTDAVGDELADAMLCHRVWEAWSVGTMTEDDFSQASDDEEFVAQIVDAVIAVRLPVTASNEVDRELLREAWRAGAAHGARKCQFSTDGDECPENPYLDPIRES